jgi:hypothetical protein
VGDLDGFHVASTSSSQEKRIEKLESLVDNLVSLSTHAYIALLSIPRRYRNEDPDFDKSTKRISEELDQIYKTLEDKSEIET